MGSLVSLIANYISSYRRPQLTKMSQTEPAPVNESSKKDPVTRPLDNLEQLLAWTKAELGGLSPIPLEERSSYVFPGASAVDFDRLSPVSGPVARTLVCHDFKGGYLDDRFCLGRERCDERPYALTAWACLDAFIYFSHHFVSPPPLGWISAAHKHGVPALGTIITEWDEGEKLCREIFAGGAEGRAKFVKACAELAQQSGFDGWLVNIENPLTEEEVKQMVLLVKELTEEMHARVPGSLVIWYDAVTTEGKLEWQNELNRLNGPFFDACDGIFVNYTWKVASTECNCDSLSECTKFLEKANDRERLHDVYVGVDVFGRGCYGGGGFKCIEALNVIRKHDLSMALFAPAWTLENASDPDCDECVNSRDQTFWELLQPKVYLKGIKLLKKPGSTCYFSTNFGLGYGRASDGDGSETRGSCSTAPNGSSGGKWRLDMGSQAFQSSFVHPHPGEASSSERDYVCTPGDEKGRDGMLVRTAGASVGTAVTIPLLLCELAEDSGVNHLTFVVGVKEGSALKSPASLRLRIIQEDGSLKSEQVDQNHVEKSIAGESWSFSASLLKHQILVAVGLLLPPGAELLLKSLVIR